MHHEQFEAMREFAAQIRTETIYCIQRAGGGHIGGAMSIADVLAVLYRGVMKYDAKNPRWEGRDRLIVSKGHSGPAVYSALALSGFFPVEELKTLNQGGTRLPSHCDRNKTPGIDMTTGSLGQGISCACGIAAALRVKRSDSRVYAIVGDGELQEGQVWEALEFAAHRSLSNLIVFVDYNKRQLDGTLEEICNPFSLLKKFEAFGLNTVQVTGYDVEAIYRAVCDCQKQAKASVIILDTFKGIGCDFAEQAEFNHYMTYTKEMADGAVAEVQRRLALGLVVKEEGHV